MRRTKIGYMVKLLKTKDACRQGKQVHVSVAEFHIHKGETDIEQVQNEKKPFTLR
jgi:hypothetical protein